MNCASPNLYARVLTPSTSGCDPRGNKEAADVMSSGWPDSSLTGSQHKGETWAKRWMCGEGAEGRQTAGNQRPPRRGWTRPSLLAPGGASAVGSWVLDLQPRGQRGDGCICHWSWCLGTWPREPVGLQRAPVLASAASASAGEGPLRRCCPFCREGGDRGEHPGVVQTRSPWEPGSRLQEGMSRGAQGQSLGTSGQSPHLRTLGRAEI